MTDRVRIAQAISQRILSVFDCVEVVGHPRQYGFLRHFQDERILGRHRVEQGVQFEVLNENPLVRRRGASEIEVAIPVHEKGFHDVNRSRNWEWVRRYFSATEMA